jgi:transposase
MKKKYKVCLTVEERTAIQSLIYSRTASNTIKKRANIVLLSDNSVGKPMSQEEIAVRCGVSDVTVYKTVKDYCLKGAEYALKFKRTKSTNPAIVTGDTEARIIALACSNSPEGTARWSIRLLTEKTLEYGIMESVSRETIRNTLKKHNLSLG